MDLKKGGSNHRCEKEIISKDEKAKGTVVRLPVCEKDSWRKQRINVGYW